MMTAGMGTVAGGVMAGRAGSRNAAAWTHVDAAERAQYAAGDRKLEITLLRAKDATGAFGMYQWLRPVDAKPAQQGERAVEKGDTVLFQYGNYVLELVVSDGELQSTPDVINLTAIERAEVAILVLDATEGVADQDQHIARDIADAGRAMLVALNKWDLVPEERRVQEEIRRRVRHALRFVAYAPVRPVSAKQRSGIGELLTATTRVADAYAFRVATGPLNRAVEAAETATPPPADARGRRVKILYATQVRAAPPTVVLFVNNPDLMPENYLRYLERSLRVAFPLEGTPLRFILRRRGQGRT